MNQSQTLSQAKQLSQPSKWRRCEHCESSQPKYDKLVCMHVHAILFACRREDGSPERRLSIKMTILYVMKKVGGKNVNKLCGECQRCT